MEKYIMTKLFGVNLDDFCGSLNYLVFSICDRFTNVELP